MKSESIGNNWTSTHLMHQVTLHVPEIGVGAHRRYGDIPCKTTGSLPSRRGSYRLSVRLWLWTLVVVCSWIPNASAQDASEPRRTDPRPPALSDIEPLTGPPAPVVSDPLAEAGDDPQALGRMARHAYEYGGFDLCAKAARKASDARGATRDIKAETLRLWGVCAWLSGDKDAARRAFLRLLEMEPDAVLDPVYVPPPIIEFFERVRVEAGARPLDDEREAGPRPDGESGGMRLVRRELRPAWLNIVPFGAGQFQNGEPLKGGLFAGAQALALGTNIGAWAGVMALRGTDGRYSVDNARLARDLRVVQFSALGVFAALYLWGVIDGFVRHRPEVVVEDVWIPAEPPPLAPSIEPPTPPVGPPLDSHSQAPSK